VKALVAAAENTSIRCIEFLLRYDAELEAGVLDDFVRAHHIVTRVRVHSAPATYRRALFAEDELIDGGLGQKEIEFYRSEVSSCQACGSISEHSIKAPTVQQFMEYSQHNGCLNRKISIDVDGAIKNCPSFARSFGTIGSTSLSEIVKRAEFREVWDIRKDDVDVCKDCEFRYACTDCRAYTADGTLYGKPLKCGYDPYSGGWALPDAGARLASGFSQEVYA
jgi:SPASM domain peptide maturase of grasp-with-spasm system